MKVRLTTIFFLVFIGLAIGLLAVFIGQEKPPIMKEATLRIDIRPSPDFRMELNASLIVTFPNRVIAFNALFTGVNEFAGDIVVTLEGLPAGITAEFFPSDTVTLGLEPRGIQINLTIPDDQSLVGVHDITVRATSTRYN